MDCTASFLPYQQTGFFSRIISDYLSQANTIQPFYQHPITPEGIAAAISNRRKFSTDRALLVEVLKQQYATVETSEKVKQHIEMLLDENTFTICTAHQPNIFTGPLYFIYKILHAVKMAEELQQLHPTNHFVPVYYMGSEDADLDELGHIFINGEKFSWETSQTGAVGRMTVDKNLVKLLDGFNGQLSVLPFGNEIMAIMKAAYVEGNTIEQATFHLVNQLFAGYGVVVLLPDNATLKKAFLPVIEKELLEGFSHKAVDETIATYPAEYKVQASGRELNMFYLSPGRRDRIELSDETWSVINTDLHFSKDALLSELESHPERFSPNVILRPVFQEWILPNIAFIGGGGEIAYWLQLKKVFEAMQVPYPVLVLRNSFLFINDQVRQLTAKVGFSAASLFQSGTELLNQLVKRDSQLQVSLEKELAAIKALYEQISTVAGAIDTTLVAHTASLEKQVVKKLETLEKKMLRAEKLKFEAQQRQLEKIKGQLFPNNNLQERVDNLLPYYAQWGSNFIQLIYDHSHGMQQQFGILTEKKPTT